MGDKDWADHWGQASDQPSKPGKRQAATDHESAYTQGTPFRAYERPIGYHEPYCAIVNSDVRWEDKRIHRAAARFADPFLIAAEWTRLDRDDDLWRGCCPICKAEPPTFVVDRNARRFRCEACETDGDGFELCWRLEGVSYAVAAVIVAAKSGLCIETLDRMSREHPR